MRVFLRSSKTGRYYGESGQLDAAFDNASEFPSVQAATRRALASKLREVEIVLRCDYLSQEVLLPVVPEWCDLDENRRRRTSVAAAPLRVPA
jgi:hypothetical protein